MITRLDFLLKIMPSLFKTTFKKLSPFEDAHNHRKILKIVNYEEITFLYCLT